MPTILAISSAVASGHVGLSAIVPALNALGHEVIALPTVLLSNHPGHPSCAGLRIEPSDLSKMCHALAANGRLDDIAIVLTGYLPTVAHVAFARDTVERLRHLRPQTRYVCDPVLGDDPKGLYIDPDAAATIRDTLVPMADLVTPNRFELSWLTGQPVATIADAVTAARRLPTPASLATSIPADRPDRLATVSIEAADARATITPRRERVPNGTGDLLAAVFAADTDLGRASARIAHTIEVSLGHPELALVTAIRAWPGLSPLPTIEVSG